MDLASRSSADRCPRQLYVTFHLADCTDALEESFKYYDRANFWKLFADLSQVPFTTIDPNRAVGYLQIPCACSRTSLPGNTPPSSDESPPLQKRCKPNYGACQQGTRSVPIELLDVAGLVPGAHQGKGLGNKFLDDLRHADALIHVVDVSGTTDAEGKATRGYE